jgi:hypothetical protein
MIDDIFHLLSRKRRHDGLLVVCRRVKTSIEVIVVDLPGRSRKKGVTSGLLFSCRERKNGGL